MGPKLILYMQRLHHDLPHGISLYTWGIEWNPIQLRHWRCPFKRVNNDAIESVMKINMCTKTFSVMHPLQVSWHRVKWDWHLIYAEGSCKGRSMMRPTLTISIYVHFIYLYLLHYFYLCVLFMYLLHHFTCVLYITMYLSIYILKVGD